MSFRIILLLLVLISCKAGNKINTRDDGRIELVIVQVNDVYEIGPIAGGRQGGMARIATLAKQLKKENPNTLLVMAGDFLSPSVYNSLQHEGKRIRGRQMVEAMNEAGFDLVTFGNHEFDISEDELMERMADSKFEWISINVILRNYFPNPIIREFKDADGTAVKIGFLGKTAPLNMTKYVSYKNFAGRKEFDQIKDSCDAVIAITHQDIEDDIRLVNQIPGIALVIGGHEHDMRLEKVNSTYITKAHANARSAYVIRIVIDKNRKEVSVNPELKYLDDKIPLDTETSTIVSKWTAIADANYRTKGFEPSKIVVSSGEPLEGRESIIRSHGTNLTRFVANAMAFVCPKADLSIYNTGTIQLDDVLIPPVTQNDVLRSMPYGGAIIEVDMKGGLLSQIIEAGEANKTTGAFLQYNKTIQPDPEKIYRVALIDFLLTGREKNLGFLTPTNPAITKIHDEKIPDTGSKSDIRLALIQYLQSLDLKETR